MGRDVLGVTLCASLGTGTMKELLFSSRCWYVSELTSASGGRGYVFWGERGVCCPRTHVRGVGGVIQESARLSRDEDV